MTLVISGTGSSASCGRSSREVALEALVRQADRVDHPRGVSHSRGGGLPVARREGDRLGDEGANGKRSSSASPNTRRAAIASNVPEPLTIGWASSSPQKARRHGDGHLGQRGGRRGPGRRRRRARSRRARRDDAAEAGPEAAGHAGLQGQLGRARRARRTARGPPRASAAGRRRRRPRAASASSSRGEQVGDEAVVAGRAVVGGHLRVAKQRAPCGVGARRGSRAAPAPARRGRAARPGG